jgi:hypothetical protein
MIVTHQKRTMEIASMMYGVSLNKDGTTKILCQRLEHTDEAPETDAESGEEDGEEGGHPAEARPDLVEVPESEPVG